MIFRVNKTSNYTVISNEHLRSNMSLKAKGLLSVILSLPDTWDYSIAGLVSICKEGKSAVMSAIEELKANGYMEIVKIRDEKTGHFQYAYNVYEQPLHHDELYEDEELSDTYPQDGPDTENQVLVTYPQEEEEDICPEKDEPQYVVVGEIDLQDIPDTGLPELEKPELEKPALENRTQLNTNKLNTKKIIINELSKDKKEEHRSPAIRGQLWITQAPAPG